MRARLKLADVAPDLIQLHRSGKLSLDMLMAFTVSSDQRRQLEVHEQLEKQNWLSPHTIRHALTETAVASDSRLGKFVGVQPYRTAGGAIAIEEDLFAEDNDRRCYFLNRELVSRMADEKLELEAKKLCDTWKWASAVPDINYETTSGYGRVHGEAGTPTDEETEQIRALEGEIKQLDAEPTKRRRRASRERTLAGIEHVIARRRVYSDDERAMAGCLVSISHDGDLRVEHGLVRPEDIPKQSGKESSQVDTPRDDQKRNASPQAEAAKSNGMTIPMVEDLECVRTAIVRARLAAEPDAAFDLLTFTLASQLRDTMAYGYDDPGGVLSLTARAARERPANRLSEEEFALQSPGEALLMAATPPMKWATARDEAERWKGFRALAKEERQRVLAYCVARLLVPQISFSAHADHAFEDTVERLGIDFAATVRPTAKYYWARLSKKEALKTASEVLGEAWVKARAKLKRAELAEALEKAFRGEDDTVDAAGADRAKAWSMTGFAANAKREKGEQQEG